MAARVQWVPYGRTAILALAEAISAQKHDDPLAPVNIVVPSNNVGVTTRRLLGSGELGKVSALGNGIAATTFLTIYRMAELLGAAGLAARGRRPVSTPVIAAALRAALAEDPGIFASVAEHPATEAALVAVYRELRDLSPAALARLGATSVRAADVVRLHRSARNRLEATYYDEEDLVGAAIEVLESQQASTGFDAPMIVYLPHRLSRHGALLLATLARRIELSVLAGTTGDPAADSETLRSIRRIDADAPLPEISVTSAALSAERTLMVTVSDADEEVRAAVRAVVDAARAGIAFERIAILYPTPEPYARLVHEQLAAAGIAHNGSASVPLTERLAGRSLLGLLRLPKSGFRREDVFAWLVGARLYHRGMPVPGTAWERCSREAGVVAGREQWDQLLARYVRTAEEEADQLASDPDVSGWRAGQRHEEASRASELRHFVLDLIDDLTASAVAKRSWEEHSGWALRHLSALLPENRRSHWPLAEQKAAERVERALERLGTLGAVEGPVDLDVFGRTLELELAADLGRVGRLGEGLLVGPLSFGPGSDLSLLVVVGLAEGLLPAPVRDDPLLPDREREVAGEELALRAYGVERQHHDLLAACAAAERQLLLVPRGDLRRGGDRVPSRWVLDIASRLGGERLFSEEFLSMHAPWLEHVPSHEAGLRRAVFPATEQEYRLCTLLAQGGTPQLERIADPVLSAGAALVAARRSSRFTRFDGNLAGLDLPSPAERVTSATRLETWAACPLAYLLGQVLAVEEIENPEDRLRISPLDLGSLVHEVLERFIADVVARTAGEQPEPGAPWDREDRALLLALADEVCARYQAEGRVGRAIFWRRDRSRLLADLERFLREDDAHRAVARTRPVAAELSFGLRGAHLGPVALSLPDGRAVQFRGRADRLDVAEDGAVEVLDYKTGRFTDYSQLNANNPDASGRKLQLPVYALAAQSMLGEAITVRSAYWFVSTRGGFRRVGYPVTAEVLERVGQTVGQIVAGIEAGVFPNHPTATSTTPYVECAYCDPDGLGVADLRRQIERKRNDPQLAVFVELTEGLHVGDNGGDSDG